MLLTNHDSKAYSFSILLISIYIYCALSLNHRQLKKILIIGAGKSSVFLIEYLLKEGLKQNWHVTVLDANRANAESRILNYKNATALQFDVSDTAALHNLVEQHHIIVSMLPAHMHGDVAKACVSFGKHMVTASYVSDTMRALDEAAKSRGIILLNECGLDPGIDHASAMKIIDELHAKGATINSFKSYCGGLVAPESNTNPWGYKFSWNPRNVVLAGQNTAAFLEDNQIKHIPEDRIFTQIESIAVEGLGEFDGYANRDSLSYIPQYNVKGLKTMLRGTLRQSGFCKAWQAIRKLGLTDDRFTIQNANQFDYTSLALSFLNTKQDLKQAWKVLMVEDWDDEVESKLAYLGFFSHEPITLEKGTPAQLLQNLLERKWQLLPEDKDMIVMQHIFEYELEGKAYRLFSSLEQQGQDQTYTAMAKTVGLPAAIATKLILNGQIEHSGIMIPTFKQLYEPLLLELASFGIVFKEKQVRI